MKRIAILTFALITSLASGCVEAPADPTDGAAIAVTREQVAARADAPGQASLVEAGTRDSLTCPGAGTCERAFNFCVDPSNPRDSWCRILASCYACGFGD